MPHSMVKVKRQHSVSMGVLTLELGGIKWREREPDADDGIGRGRGADQEHETEEAGASEVVGERTRTMRASENAIGRRLDLESVSGRPAANSCFDMGPHPRKLRIGENRFQFWPCLLELTDL